MTGEVRTREIVSPLLRAALLDASETLDRLNEMRYRANRMAKPEPSYVEACAQSRRKLETLSSYLRREAASCFRNGILLIIALKSLRQTVADVLESEPICADTRNQLLAEVSCACVIEYYASAHGPGLPYSSAGRITRRVRAPSAE